MFYRLSLYAQAAIMALAGYFLFSIVDTCAKLLSARYPIEIIFFVPSAIATIGIGLRIMLSQGVTGFRSTYMPIHLSRAIVITLFVVLCVNALKLIPIADYYCVIFLSPFVVMGLSVLLYKEEIHHPRIIVLILSFIGVVIAIGPHFHEANAGYILAVACVFLAALNVFLVRKIGPDDNTALLGFFPVLGVSVFSLPFAVPHFMNLDMPMIDIFIFLGYGICLMGAHTLLPMAFARTPSMSKLTPLHYSQMVWGILAGIFIFDRPVEINTLLGGGLIVAAGLGLFFYEHRASKKAPLVSG